MKLYTPRNTNFYLAITSTIIAARNRLGVIGVDNKLPWHCPEDLKMFKQVTNYLPIIMGRKTFESLPGLLPNRKHIVLTRQPDYVVPEGVVVVDSFDAAFEWVANDCFDTFSRQDVNDPRLILWAKRHGHDSPAQLLAFLQENNVSPSIPANPENAPILKANVCIIGGAEIYRQALQFADKAIITEMDNEVEGDAFFPEIPKHWWMHDATCLTESATSTLWRNKKG